MYKCSAFLFLFFVTLIARSQDFTFGEITHEDYNFNRKTIDSTANAVVLKEFGTARLQIDDNTGRLVLFYDYHVKIKIFNKDGFNAANVVIPFYKQDDRAEMVSDVIAATINIDNGQLIRTNMDKKGLFSENKTKFLSLTKFTLPNVREGSVIEYSYRITSPFYYNFRTWEFQSEIPKLNSEFVAFIPANYNYNVLLRGFQKLSDQKSDISRECLRIAGAPMDCSKMTYIMKNIPAFVGEEFMTAASNFKSAIYFELSDIQLLDGGKQAFTKTWKDVDFELVYAKYFGSQMKKKEIFKEILPKVIGSTTDELEKAKQVYNFIKKQIKWNNYYSMQSDENLKNVLESRTGSVAEINFALISALSAASLDVEAVLLSTRDNGIVNKIYPVISEFNYVVAKLNIGDKVYLLDATDPMLPFGLLPLRCINDKGRVINLKKPSYWIDLTASQKSVTKYVFQGKLEENGKIVGTINTVTNGYAAYNKRREIKSHNSIEEYVEKLDEKWPKISISNQQILNVDSVELPLIETFNVEFTSEKSEPSNKQVFLNPFLVNRTTKNPFNLNERMYPVDLGAALDERITVSITLPPKYTVIEKPKDVSIGLPESAGRYLLQSSVSDNVLAVSQIIQLNKAIYTADEYLYLKEFYSKIIQNQKTDVLLSSNN